MNNILMWLMLGFIGGLFARKTLDFFEALVENLRRVRVEIDLQSDRAMTFQQDVQPSGSLSEHERAARIADKPAQMIAARTVRRKRAHRGGVNNGEVS